MAIYVYRTADGSLYSWSPNDSDPVASAAQLAAQGMASVSAMPALDASHAWDPATKTVIAVTPAPAPKWMPTFLFVNLFTDAEHTAIALAATPGQATFDAKVSKFMLMLQTAQQVNLNDPLVQGGVNYLASVNLLTAANAALILSGQASQ